MKISAVVEHLEHTASPSLQESYDNAGLITGNINWECSGILVCLDATVEVLEEAKKRNCNLVVAHHPILFRGIKRITGSDYVQQALIAAIKNDIAIYAIHTNLDNVIHGVSGKMAEVLNLQNVQILSGKQGTLAKLYTFVPIESAEEVRKAIFEAGGGNIGNYSECSFNSEGKGTFKAKEGADPYIGEIGKPTTTNEIKIEVVFPVYLEHRVVPAMLKAHPYEEVAYDVIKLENYYQAVGTGVIGELKEPLPEELFLKVLKQKFNVPLIRHTPLCGKTVKRGPCAEAQAASLFLRL